MGLVLMRRIPFCAGHRLFGHGGKCEFFHGHNYIADFHVVGDAMDDVGRVVDFAQLKAALKGWIDEHWDHGFVLFQGDENGLAAIRQVQPSKYFVLPANPTAENMALHLLHVVCPEILTPLGVRAIKVVLWETSEAYAEATLDAVPSSTVDVCGTATIS